MYTGVYWTELYTGLYTRHTLVYTGLGWTLAVHWIYTGVYTKLYTRYTLVYTGLGWTLDCTLAVSRCALDYVPECQMCASHVQLCARCV